MSVVMKLFSHYSQPCMSGLMRWSSYGRIDELDKNSFYFVLHFVTSSVITHWSMLTIEPAPPTSHSSHPPPPNAFLFNCQTSTPHVYICIMNLLLLFGIMYSPFSWDLYKTLTLTLPFDFDFRFRRLSVRINL